MTGIILFLVVGLGLGSLIATLVYQASAPRVLSGLGAWGFAVLGAGWIDPAMFGPGEGRAMAAVCLLAFGAVVSYELIAGD